MNVVAFIKRKTNLVASHCDAVWQSMQPDHLKSLAYDWQLLKIVSLLLISTSEKCTHQGHVPISNIVTFLRFFGNVLRYLRQSAPFHLCPSNFDMVSMFLSAIYNAEQSFEYDHIRNAV